MGHNTYAKCKFIDTLEKLFKKKYGNRHSCKEIPRERTCVREVDRKREDEARTKESGSPRIRGEANRGNRHTCKEIPRTVPHGTVLDTTEEPLRKAAKSAGMGHNTYAVKNTKEDLHKRKGRGNKCLKIVHGRMVEQA